MIHDTFSRISEYSNIIYLGMNIFWRRLSKPRRQISDLRRPCDRNVVTPSVLLGGKPSSGSSRKSKSWRIQTRVIRIKNVHNSGQNKVYSYTWSVVLKAGENNASLASPQTKTCHIVATVNRNSKCPTQTDNNLNLAYLDTFIS